MPDFTIHWHQAEPELVDGWEFQFQRVGGDWEFVQRVQDSAAGCVDCFEAQVELPRLAFLVRSRSIRGDEFSEWSREIPVHAVPEPGFTLALLIGVLWLAIRSISVSHASAATAGTCPFPMQRNRSTRAATP